VPRWLEVKGSFDAALRVRVGTRGLYLSGNPTKALTGQNLDGPESAAWLLSRVANVCTAALGLPNVLSIVSSRFSRVDVTRSYDVGSVEWVREIVRIAGITGRAKRQGGATISHTTVYWGQHSRRHSVKMYCKADELRTHPPSIPIASVCSSIQAAAGPLLRVELTLRGKQLEEDGTQEARFWLGPSLADHYFERYWPMIQISDGVALMPEEVAALPRTLRRTYELWLRGGDCAELLSNGSRYRHRAAILAATGGSVDIFVLRPSSVAPDLARECLGSYLRSLEPWKSEGRLSEWIEQTAGAA